MCPTDSTYELQYQKFISVCTATKTYTRQRLYFSIGYTERRRTSAKLGKLMTNRN